MRKSVERYKGLFGGLVLFGWLGPALLSVNLRTETPFEIHVNARVATVPLRLRVESRYDVELVRGTLCLVVDGEEFHTSCWDADGTGARMHVTEVLLEHGGEYAVQLQQVSGNGHRQSNVAQLLLQ